MTSQLINGVELSNQLRQDLQTRVKALTAAGHTPGLAVILVGENPASQVYVRNKVKACEQVGIHSVLEKTPDTLTEKDLLVKIDALNQDPSIHGMLVQLPLPAHTPFGCLKMLESIHYDLKGKHAVVIGRSNIVGKPMAMMLLQKNATVTLCHSHTKNLAELTRQADLIVAAVGVRNVLTKDMVKPGAVVLDVGMNRDEDGKLCGDVDFDGVRQVAAFITPVPGGVGPMTITMLLHNTVWAAEQLNPTVERALQSP